MRSIIRSLNDHAAHGYVDPAKELNAGLWTLFAGASAFLALRVWIKITRRHGLWYDDYILILSWVSARLIMHLQSAWGRSRLVVRIADWRSSSSPPIIASSL